MDTKIGKIKELREELGNLAWQMEDVAKRSLDQNREMTKDEDAQFVAMSKDYDSKNSQLERLLKLQKITADQARQVNGDARNKENTTATYEDAFYRYMDGRATTTDHALLSKGRAFKTESRGSSVQVTGTDSLGGYLIPEGFSNELEKYTLYSAPMLDEARIFNTATGNVFPWPTVDDTATSGNIQTEGSAPSVSDITFAEVSFSAYTIDSGIVKTSRQMEQDSYFNLETLVAELGGERIGRKINNLLTVGTGSSQPNGIITASGAGKTAASATAITSNEILDLIHSVDASYRKSKAFKLMMHDSTLKAIRQLSIGASDDRGLWQPAMADGTPATIHGVPYLINNDMAEIATTNKTILAADFSKYVVRNVVGVGMLRMGERYGDELNIGYILWRRLDGNAINTSAIKHLVQA